MYIPSDVVSIGEGAFKGSEMKKVRFLGDTVSIGDGAFRDCANLESIELPESLREIGERAFQGCRKLAKIRVPGGVREIKPNTFLSCGAPSAIELSEGVESLGSGFCAFSRPAKLSLPRSLKSIDRGAFARVNGNVEVTLADGNEAFKTEDGCLYARDGKTLLFVPRSVEELNVPEGVETVGDFACYTCESLVSVRLPRTLTSIGFAAFRRCAALSSVNIPEGVTYIGGQAFYGCPSLESVSIPDGVAKIENGTFEYCERLKFAHLPRGLTRIGENAFHGCRALSSVTIPASVEEIGEDAFALCVSLKEAVFENPSGWIYRPAGAENAGRTEVDPDIVRNSKKAGYCLRAKWKKGMAKRKGRRAGADSGWRRLK